METEIPFTFPVPDVIALARNTSAWEVEVGGHPGLHETLSINETSKNNTYFILSLSLRITGPVCRIHSKQTTDTWCRLVSLPHSIGTSQLCGCLQLPPKDTELCSWLCFSVLSAAMPRGGFEVCKGSLGFASLDLVASAAVHLCTN